MAFKNRNFDVMSYANGFTMWRYDADESIEHVLEKGFFNPVSTLCQNADVIILPTVQIYISAQFV